MKKKLINELSEFIKKDAEQLCQNLNSLVRVFHALQPFEKIKENDQAFDLAYDPLDYFDLILVQNYSGELKGSFPFQAHTAAHLLNIDYEGFKEAIKMQVPGTDNRYFETVRLSKDKRQLFTWNGEEFVINPDELNEACEVGQFFHEAWPQQMEYLRWSNLVNDLNAHSEHGYLQDGDKNQVATILGLRLHEGEFILDNDKIGKLLRNI